MPMIDQVETAPPSHYECTAQVKARSVTAGMQAKHRVLTTLPSLEGWCSSFKAGALFDIMLLFQPDVVVEIGVYGGKSLVPMAMGLQENNKGIIYGIDPWSAGDSVQGMDGVNKDWWGKLDHERILACLASSIVRLNLRNIITLVRNTSADAADIHNIDVLHIDGNHSEQSALFDVNKWVPLVKTGGLIIFDDTTWGTTGAAVTWLNANCIKLFETVDVENCWGVWVKR